MTKQQQREQLQAVVEMLKLVQQSVDELWVNAKLQGQINNINEVLKYL